MSAIQSKGHITIDGYLFMIARMPRIDRHIYGREEAPHFVNKMSSGDPNYRDSTFFPHWVQNNWTNGFDQEKFSDGGKFFRSSQVDPTTQEELSLQKALESVGTLPASPKCFGIRTSASARWWSDNYAYRKQLTITAPGGVSVPTGYPVKLTIDTAALQTASKLLANRNDLRIVYDNGSTYVELFRDYIDTTTTFFATQATIAAGQTDNNYYVYYGYASESTNKQPTAEADWNAVYGFFGTTPDTNTKGIWHMREGSGTAIADDSVGAGDATAGGQTWALDGKFGRYISIAGGDAAYKITAPTGSNFDLNSMTLEGWYNFADLDKLAEYRRFFSRKASGYTANAYALYYTIPTTSIPTNGIQFETTNAAGSTDRLSYAFTPVVGTWYHVAATYDGTTKKIFLNGVEVASSIWTDGVVASENELNIYNGYSNGSPPFGSQKLQHVRVSNVARSSFPYALSSEPTVAAGDESLKTSSSSTGVFEIYAGLLDGTIQLFDGTNSWSEAFNTRRLEWFDTIANGDEHLIVGDTAGTETAQAQSFQLDGACKVKAVQVYLKKNAGTPGDITVTIETNSTDKPSGTLANANLTTTIPAFTTSTYGWITVEFPSASSVVLTASTTYWIVLKTAAAANDQNYAWNADGSSPSYSAGTMAVSTNGGSTWSAVTGKDALFRVLGETTTVNQITQAYLSSSTKLYFATGDPTNTSQGGARIYTYDGTTWLLNKLFTGAGSGAVMCLQVFNSKLYAGLSPTASIQSTSDGSTWAESKNIDDPDNPGYVYDMEVYNGRLYACGGHPEYVINNNSQGFLYSYDDYSWAFVYDFAFTVVTCMKVYDSLLFLGTYHKRLYVYNTASMDKLVEFPWDVKVSSLEVYDDKLAVALDGQSALTGEEGIFIFDRNGFNKAYTVSAVGFTCMKVIRNTLYVGTTGTTAYRVSTAYVTSGWLQTSYFEAQLPSMDKQQQSLGLLFDELPTGCSITTEYKKDESDAAWISIGVANTAGDIEDSFDFPDSIYGKKISLKITLATSDTSKTPTLKLHDLKYLIVPDFKYMWRMKLACPDNIVWLDKTRPISTTTAAITLAQVTLPLTDASGFPTKGRAVVVDAGVEDEFTWTGKSTNTLTGVVGLLAHTSIGLIVKITGATMHKQILTLKQTKTFYDFVDIDGLTYNVLFHQYQADDFVVNQDDGLENNVPITLLQV